MTTTGSKKKGRRSSSRPSRVVPDDRSVKAHKLMTAVTTILYMTVTSLLLHEFLRTVAIATVVILVVLLLTL